MIALLIAGIMLHPTFLEIVGSGEPFHVFGIPMIPTMYSSTVFPMIMSTWVMAQLEKLLKRIIPEILTSILLPLLTVLIMLPIALCILGPLGSIIGVYLGQFLVWLHTMFGPFGVAICFINNKQKTPSSTEISRRVMNVLKM